MAASVARREACATLILQYRRIDDERIDTPCQSGYHNCNFRFILPVVADAAIAAGIYTEAE